MTHAELCRFMQKSKLGVLASICDAASPQTALVGIAVTPLLEIVFDTLNSSRKYRNLKTNHACSFVIGWAGEQTVQYEGTAEELMAPELETYRAIYFNTHPDCAAHMSCPGICYFVVRPKWIRYSDFDQAPPLIQEIVF